MAIPKCPKCDGTSFSAEELKPSKSQFKFWAICCVKCGAIVGVQEYQSPWLLIRKLAEKLNINLGV